MHCFRPEFLSLVKDTYEAPFQPLDFVKNPTAATQRINDWVENQTQQRIRDVIPEGALDDLTRLVVVNAIYLKAPWAEPFQTSETKPAPFHVDGGKSVDVPMMAQRIELPYSNGDGCIALKLPYSGHQLQFLILLPAKVNGLAALEAKLTPDAATAIHFGTKGIHEPKKPVEVRVDHPFLFAILHQPSGACLFRASG